MQKTKLIKLLKLLEGEELKQFPKFIKSPFFNSNKHFLPLFNYLKKFYPDFNSPKLKRELVFDKIFPGKAFHYNIYNNLISGFIKLTEEYLVHLQIKKEPFEQQKILLNAYEQRPQGFDFFKKQMKSLKTRLEKTPYRNIHYFKEKVGLDQMWFNHPGVDRHQLKHEEYRTYLEALDNYFILEKLLLSSELVGRGAFLSENYNIWLLDEIMAKSLDNPLYQVFVDILGLIKTGNKTTYLKLKTSFESNIEAFNWKEKKDILQVLINYAINQGNAGDTFFIQENFELYKLALKQKLFFKNAYMNDYIYLNIVGVAVKVEEFAWCFDFINSYESLLDNKVRKDAKSLSLSIWFYYQNKLSEAINHLHDFDFINDFYQLRGRALLTKIYFEQFLTDHSYYDLLIMQCHSFEKYIRRNSLIASTKEKAYLDFILLLRKLSKSIMDFKINADLRSKWLNWIDTKPYLYGKHWLKEQILALQF